MTQKGVDTFDIGVLTVIPAELEATLAAFDVKKKKDGFKSPDGTNYWRTEIRSQRDKRKYNVVISCIGSTGNYDSAAATTALIKEHYPQIVFLLGIAAGVRGAIKIGEVVLSERVIAYEPAALRRRGKRSIVEPRTDAATVEHSIEQDIVAYQPSQTGLNRLLHKIGGKIPEPQPGKEQDYSAYVASSICVRASTIATGEKLLRDPEKLKTLRRNVHGKIEVGEMEAGGFYRACRRERVVWLVVRGISDFGDHLKSDEFHEFASRSAAAVLVNFVRTGLSLKWVTKGARTVIRDRTEYPHLEDLRAELDLLVRPASHDRAFALRVSLAGSYDEVAEGRFLQTGLAPKDVLSKVKTRKLIIHAPGGSGKTAVMCRVAKVAMDQDWIVFFLDLKTGSGGTVLCEDFHLGDLFEAFAIAGTFSNFEKSLKLNQRVLLLVDGLNEVYGTVSDLILKLLEDLVLAHQTLSVIIADRMNPHPEVRYQRAGVDPVSGEEINTLIARADPSWHAEHQLLSVPFFLDLQLELDTRESKDTGSAKSVISRKDMFNVYFQDVARIHTEGFTSLAEAAFEAYKKYSGRTFEKAWWDKTVTPNISRLLEKSGITVETVAGHGQRMIMFRHQLIHDYLVGSYLANVEDSKWESEVFDSATFKANAVEALSFAAEILGSRSDEFLIRVYDWSYRSVNRVIGDLTRSVVKVPLSEDLMFFIAAKNAEQLFAVFEDSVKGAKTRLLETGTPEAAVFLKAGDLKDVLKAVKEYQPTTERFQNWKDLFGKPEETIVRERELVLVNGDPIIGWTAANVFRRLRLPETHISSLRTMYYVALQQGKGVLRWRIIHVLGKYPSAENVAFLLDALVDDPYEWAKYGAIRGLMEIASQCEEMRDRIIEELISRLDNTASRIVLLEIRRTCLVRNAAPEWYRAVGNVVRTASRCRESEKDRTAWEELLEEIDRRCEDTRVGC